MRELGESSQEMHNQLAHEICNIIPHESRVSFYLVGPMMQQYATLVLENYFDVYCYLSSHEAWEQIRDDLGKNKTDTIVYAKGSQNTIFIEEWLKQVLRDPLDMEKLPRQSASWMEKKNIFFKSLEK